jgi:regulator of RNase E activity RraA
MPFWKNENELFAIMRDELYTAVVGDIMDQMGLYHQFLPQKIQPLDPNSVLVGYAMTVLQTDWFESNQASQNDILSQPFGLMLQALDDLRQNEIYLCTGSSPRYALWGELMSARAKKSGARGAVLNGFIRDTRGIIKQKFPCFSLGPYAQDQRPRGKVVDFRITVEIDGVRIESGDLVFGDIDGVCVVPQDAVDEVMTQAISKSRGEKTVRQAIENGMTAVDAFNKYGIM